MYEYTASKVSEYDGDTMVVSVVLAPDQFVDLGFGIRRNYHETVQITLRLYGVNAPEIKAPGPEGEQARDWADQWFVDNCPDGTFTVNTFQTSSLNPDDKKEKYGRYLAIVTAPNGRRLNDDLVTSGHAVPYMVT